MATATVVTEAFVLLALQVPLVVLPAAVVVTLALALPLALVRVVAAVQAAAAAVEWTGLASVAWPSLQHVLPLRPAVLARVPQQALPPRQQS